MHINTKFRVLEFIIAGILLDLTENLIIVKATTGRGLILKEVGLAILIIIPFAVVTELIIDHPRFWHKLFRLKGHKFDNYPQS